MGGIDLRPCIGGSKCYRYSYQSRAKTATHWLQFGCRRSGLVQAAWKATLGRWQFHWFPLTKLSIVTHSTRRGQFARTCGCHATSLRTGGTLHISHALISAIAGPLFGIKSLDRLSHIYVIGKTGVGKSTLIETLALQDLTAGRGFALVDPHGDLVEKVASQISPEKTDRVIYLNAPDPAQPYGYNPLRRVRDDKIPLAVSGLLETLKKMWPDAWGVRMEHVLRNTLYTLLERDDAKLPDILRLYSDDDYRKEIVAGVRNTVVKTFWQNEFDEYPARLRAEACAPIQNKLGALLSDPTLYRILVEPEIDLRFRSLMDEGKVLLVNVARGRLGEDSALILGSLLVSTLGLAAFSRAELPTNERKPFFRLSRRNSTTSPHSCSRT